MTAHELVERLLHEAVNPKQILRQLGLKHVPGPHEVEYDLEADWEEDSPEGHFDDPQDAALVRQQIEAGNVWGWCSTHVIAKWTDPEGNEWEGDTYLGGCSYESRKDFMEPGGYYDDMKNEAYGNLVRKLVKAGYRE